MELKEKHVKEQEAKGMKNTIKLVTSESGDWEVLFLNDEIYDEGHNIPTHTWLNIITRLGCDVNTIELTDEEMESGLY